MNVWRVAFYHQSGEHMGPECDMLFMVKERAEHVGEICVGNAKYGLTYKMTEVGIDTLELKMSELKMSELKV